MMSFQPKVKKAQPAWRAASFESASGRGGGVHEDSGQIRVLELAIGVSVDASKSPSLDVLVGKLLQLVRHLQDHEQVLDEA